MYSRYMYSGFSAVSFMLSIIPILYLQHDVLQYGFDNDYRDWIKGGMLLLSWSGFTISGCSFYYLALQFEYKQTKN